MVKKYVSLNKVIKLFELHKILSKSDLSIIDNNFIDELKFMPSLDIDSLQRYDLHEKYGNKCIHEIPNGEYIRYDDLKKLLLQ